MLCYNSPGLPLSPEATLLLLLPAVRVSFALLKGLFSPIKFNLIQDVTQTGPCSCLLRVL